MFSALRSWIAFAGFVLLAGSGAAADSTPILTVQSGFTIERVAGVPEVRFPMFAALDDRGRLFVAESSGLDLYAELQKLTRKCRISVLEDRDGAGVFERAQVFAEQLVFPMGLVWREGRLFVADPPDLITLEDTDGDGRADKRTVLLTGFGHTDNGSLHGLTFGPDGWLYLTMGQPDGYRLKRADGSILSGKSGALLRCRPDGSGIEVVSRGFENLVEVEFLPSGEIIGTDNWFTFPSEGVRDALVHLVEGGLYPLQLRDAGTPMLVSGDPLPALALYPAVALSGFARMRGAHFGSEFTDNLFSAQHNTRKVVRHRFERAGATFRSVDEDFVSTQDPDFHPSDVLEDADGSVLVVDTGSWYIHHCPTGRIRNSPAPGGIYRVRSKTGRRLADPQGLKLDWTSATPAELTARLVDERPAVRDRAALALLKHGTNAVARVAAILQASSFPPAREQAVWLLSRSPGDAARAPLHQLLRSGTPDEQALTARALGRVADRSAEGVLVPLLRHEAPQVRLTAAEALANCGSSSVLPAVFDALMANNDRFIEHALVHVLYRLATKGELLAALDHPHSRVQRAALVLLDQPPHDALPAEAAAKRLFATDEGLRRAARAAVARHPDWVVHIRPGLATLITHPDPTAADLDTLRESVVAFHQDGEAASLVAQALSDGNASASDAAKLALLGAIARVPAEKLPSAWPEALDLTLGRGSPAVRAETVRTAQALQLGKLDPALSALANDSGVDAALRVEALRAVVRRQPRLTPAAFELLVARLAPTNAAAVRIAAAEVLGAAELNGQQLSRFLESTRGDALIPSSLVLSVARRLVGARAIALEILSFVEARVGAGWQVPAEPIEWLTEIVPDAQQERVIALSRALEANAARQRAQLTEFEPLLQGGDPNRGHELFLGKTGCTACHRVGTRGGVAGPDLTKVGAIRSGRDLIESLVAPSSTFAQGYEPYTVVLKDGEVLTGVRVRSADDTFTLRDASGTDMHLPPDRIASAVQGKVSLMPEGLLSALSHDEIRDLLAYLQSLR